MTWVRIPLFCEFSMEKKYTDFDLVVYGLFGFIAGVVILYSRWLWVGIVVVVVALLFYLTFKLK